MPLLQEHTSNNKCIVIEIESNISAVNNIVEINLQGKQIEQKNRLLINYLIMVQFVKKLKNIIMMNYLNNWF